MFEEIGGLEILIPEEPLSSRELEKRCVLKVLQETGGNKEKASEILGIDRTTLYKYNMKRMCSFLQHSPVSVSNLTTFRSS